ncbi:hypothetical protein ACTI_79650 [Actinoplanes sp. OR16]|uniref:hypothetical protein n=1 Tax=Actinoplanes sp. OR16 TaxID=946334 RepID=UPI000F7050DA|nr:hypothetical protein [Actinoplanes sp. OR16]BBH71280.1 hypothetical protein ACTI_79650 [Actinoplanes sp. OR16]
MFDEMIGEPPPSRVDVAAIVRRERRRRTALRTTGAAGAVLAVVVSAGLLQQARGPATEEPLALPSSPAAAPQGFRLAAEDRLSAEATAATLRGVLDEAVHRVVPRATWFRQDIDGHPPADGEPPVLIGSEKTPKADQPFAGGTGIAVSGREGVFTLQILSTRPCADPSNPKCAQENENPELEQKQRDELLLTCQPQVKDCTDGTGVDGRRFLAQTVPGEDGEVTHEARLQLADRRVLTLSVSNLVSSGGGKAGVSQATTPVSRDQLGEVAALVGARILP